MPTHTPSPPLSPSRAKVFDIICAVIARAEPELRAFGIELDYPAITDRSAFAQYLRDTEAETDEVLIEFEYSRNVPETGFYVRWELWLGCITITIAEITLYIPLAHLDTLSVDEHTEYILSTISHLLGGGLTLQIDHHEEDPVRATLFWRGHSKKILVFDSEPNAKHIPGTTTKTFQNNLAVQFTASNTVLHHLEEACVPEVSNNADDRLETINEESWSAVLNSDAEELVDESSSDQSYSMWWFAVAGAVSFFAAQQITSIEPLIRWLGEERWTVIGILTLFLTLGFGIILQGPWLAPGLRVIDRFTFTPLSSLLAKGFAAIPRKLLTAQFYKGAVFVTLELILCGFYFYDNAQEVTTGRVLTFSEMADIYPIIWLNPVLQLLAAVFFFGRRKLLFNLSVLGFTAFNIWFGFVAYNDNEVPLYGFVALLDFLTAIAILITIGYCVYVLAQPIVNILKHRRKQQIRKAWTTPNKKL